MACNRCEDVHNAQRFGKTQKGCECLCHDMLINYSPPTYQPYYPQYCPTYQPHYITVPIWTDPVWCGDADSTLDIDTGTTVTTCEDGKCSTLNLNI